jgi:hypothetical protein
MAYTRMCALNDTAQHTAHELLLLCVCRKQAPPGRAGPERAKGPFRDGLVFVIGGGNYLEREALAAWASRTATATAAGGA